MIRRDILRTTATIPLLALAMCATTPAQIATDVNLEATAASAILTAVQALPGVSSDVIVRVQGYVTKIQANAALVAATSVAPSTSTVTAITQDIQAVASIVLPLLPGGSAILALVQATTSLLPTILKEAGITGAASAVTPVYEPDEARRIMAGAH
jgi:hypothetical protein